MRIHVSLSDTLGDLFESFSHRIEDELLDFAPIRDELGQPILETDWGFHIWNLDLCMSR